MIIPPVERTAIPLNAAPLVHPLPNCAPRPNNSPPKSPAITLVLALILGEDSKVNFSLFEINPETKAPIITPITSNTSQFFKGLF